MKNCFIIHGSESNNKAHWFPWLEDELSKKYIRVFNLNFPTPQNQCFEIWQEVLKEYIEYIDEETIFVCHSIAPAFIVKFCITNGIKIGKFISVCGFNCLIGGDLDKINKTMFLEDISAFKYLCDDRVCFYSDNDPYLKFEYCEKFAKDIDAISIIIKNGGHLNTDSGYTQFPQILNQILGG